jgi:hypothetical protein
MSSFTFKSFSRMSGADPSVGSRAPTVGEEGSKK